MESCVTCRTSIRNSGREDHAQQRSVRPPDRCEPHLEEYGVPLSRRSYLTVSFSSTPSTMYLPTPLLEASPMSAPITPTRQGRLCPSARVKALEPYVSSRTLPPPEPATQKAKLFTTHPVNARLKLPLSSNDRCRCCWKRCWTTCWARARSVGARVAKDLGTVGDLYYRWRGGFQWDDRTRGGKGLSPRARRRRRTACAGVARRTRLGRTQSSPPETARKATTKSSVAETHALLAS